MKKSFTINCGRSFDEIMLYKDELLQTGVYQACELFYPTENNGIDRLTYTKNIRCLKRILPNIEFVLHLPFSQEYNIADSNKQEEAIQTLKQAIEYASLLGIKKVTLHPGFANEGEDRSLCIQNAIFEIKKLKQFASNYNITMMLENMVKPLEFMTTAEEILYFLTECDVGFTLDIGHAAISKIDIVSLIYQTKDYLMHTHIHDNHLVHDEHLSIGLGKIDFNPILQALCSIDYQYLLGMEALFSTTKDLMNNASKLNDILEEVKI